MTGLDVTIVREFTNFIQEGTPTGTMFAHCYVARVAGGVLVDEGPEGPARSYSLDALPAIMPIRVANQRCTPCLPRADTSSIGPVTRLGPRVMTQNGISTVGSAMLLQV
jgi:hypothetical protein